MFRLYFQFGVILRMNDATDKERTCFLFVNLKSCVKVLYDRNNSNPSVLYERSTLCVSYKDARTVYCGGTRILDISRFSLNYCPIAKNIFRFSFVIKYYNRHVFILRTLM